MNYQVPLPPGAVAIKEWVLQRAEAEGVTPGAIHRRLHRGKYPHMKKFAGPHGTGKRCSFIGPAPTPNCQLQTSKP
jgi:hypothetical protein